jgi:hypothetical protein
MKITEKKTEDKTRASKKALPRIKEIRNTKEQAKHLGAAVGKGQVPPPTYDNTSLFG